jgi:hypothetical protein
MSLRFIILKRSGSVTPSGYRSSVALKCDKNTQKPETTKRRETTPGETESLMMWQIWLTCAMTQRCVHHFLVNYVISMQFVAIHCKKCLVCLFVSSFGTVFGDERDAVWLRWYFSSKKISESMWKHSGTRTPSAAIFLLPSTAHFPNRDTLQHGSQCSQDLSCHGAHGSL